MKKVIKDCAQILHFPPTPECDGMQAQSKHLAQFLDTHSLACMGLQFKIETAKVVNHIFDTWVLLNEQ